MRWTRLPGLALLLTAGLLVPSTAASVAPGAPPPSAGREGDPGNGPERNGVAGTLPAEPDALRSLSVGENVRQGDHLGYPRQTRLRVFPVDPTDQSLKPGLVPYHGIAPKLNALQRRSDRVSVEVIGQSALGRDMYLVTLTAPETPWQAARQEAMRRKIEEQPAAAATDSVLRADYKVPVLVNGNIHGNEWEGTDGILAFLEDYATSTDPAVKRLLSRHRLYFNVTQNPDGRVAGTRANANGFNLNRDFATASQPETRALRPVMIDKQPVMLLDEHGYVEGTLIEPTTPPHGANYEYDLYIKDALANALDMESAVQALGYPEAQDVTIPFRDLTDGWDDWPPIFTPQYGLYHGAIGYTIEIPLSINDSDYELPATELRRRSAINTAVVLATINTTVEYVSANGRRLVDIQIEQFRRGQAGEALRRIPNGFVPGWGPEDRYTTEFPRAYVIPTGEGQRSGPAAARLVDFLVANDIAVSRATTAFRLGGKRFPAGSYVVDMHQSKRGMANVMLEAGADISDRVPTMYDISGWSHRLLWGASVDIIRRGDLPSSTEPVVAAAPTGGVEAPPGRDLLLRLVDGKDVSAANTLLGSGVQLFFTGAGNVLVPAAARAQALVVADQYGVQFVEARDIRAAKPFTRLTIAAAVAEDELYVLRELGFDVRPVSTDVLNEGFDLTDVDVLFVASGLTWGDLTADAQAGLQAFLQNGAVVTRGETGAVFNADAGLLQASAEYGSPDANGVVAVRNAPGGVVTGGSPPQSFVYSPLWFTGLGSGVGVEQRYAVGNPLISGHWRADDTGAGGPEGAAGQAAVIRGVSDSGASVVMFGTEPVFRDHTKGLYGSVSRALYWAAVSADARTAVAPLPVP